MGWLCCSAPAQLSRDDDAGDSVVYSTAGHTGTENSKELRAAVQAGTGTKHRFRRMLSVSKKRSVPEPTTPDQPEIIKWTSAQTDSCVLDHAEKLHGSEGSATDDAASDLSLTCSDNSEDEPLVDSTSYTKIRDLNRGANGFVQLARHNASGELVAIKFLHRGGAVNPRLVARELLNQRECAPHPFIVQLKEVFLTAHHLGIAMEYAPGGDLSLLVDQCRARGLQGVPEPEARHFFQQFIVALAYTHRVGIANRDIKLDNVLLDGASPRPNIKLCDFGYSKDEVTQSVCKTACGTPEYMSPELLVSDSYDGKVADIWSAGVMLYVLLTGTFPFSRPADDAMTGAKLLQVIFKRIIKAEFQPPPNVSLACRDLLEQLLTPEPEERISVSRIMRHPWFLKDAPPGLLSINDRLLSQDRRKLRWCTQRSREVVQLARQCGPGYNSAITQPDNSAPLGAEVDIFKRAFQEETGHTY